MTESRDDLILRLLDTRFDNLPEVTRRDHSARGFVHSTMAAESCPDCLANDRPMFGCETCGGRGYIETYRKVDPYAVQEVQPFGLDGSCLERSRERDRQIELMQVQVAPPKSEADLIAEANARPYAWEIARRRMYAAFDYGALDRALEQLHLFRPGSSPRSGFGLAFISDQLPDLLRVPPPPPEPVIVGKVERAAGPGAREVRDSRIRELAAQGLKPAAIAAECHVGIRTVYNIVSQAA